MIKVIDTASWRFGGSGNHGTSSGLTGQITHCEIDGIEFFTRENANALDSFQISSNERWGDKRGAKPAKHRQSLELAAPADRWDEIAEAVRKADTMDRPVLKNERFTIQIAKAFFK